MYLEDSKYLCFAQKAEFEYRGEEESGEKKIYLLTVVRGRNQPLQVHLCPCAHEQLSGDWGFVFTVNWWGFKLAGSLEPGHPQRRLVSPNMGSSKVPTSQ